MAKIILLSGGMDSFLSYRLFYPDLIPVFVDTGSRYGHLDIAFAKQQAPDIQVVNLAYLRERPDGHVPHRNTVLLASVANMLDADTICVSAPRGEMVWDQQPAYHAAMQQLLGIRILNPLIGLTKTQAVAMYLAANGQRWELVERTRSCYSPHQKQCGHCAACVKRWVALSNNDIWEPYTQDVAAYARQIASGATWREALRYGVRPAYEAWRALRRVAA